MRGPPTSGAPPVSAAQPYSQFGQSDIQNGPPSMGAPPQRLKFSVFIRRDVLKHCHITQLECRNEIKSAVLTLPQAWVMNASIYLLNFIIFVKSQTWLIVLFNSV